MRELIKNTLSLITCLNTFQKEYEITNLKEINKLLFAKRNAMGYQENMRDLILSSHLIHGCTLSLKVNNYKLERLIKGYAFDKYIPVVIISIIKKFCRNVVPNIDDLLKREIMKLFAFISLGELTQIKPILSDTIIQALVTQLVSSNTIQIKGTVLFTISNLCERDSSMVEKVMDATNGLHLINALCGFLKMCRKQAYNNVFNFTGVQMGNDKQNIFREIFRFMRLMGSFHTNIFVYRHPLLMISLLSLMNGCIQQNSSWIFMIHRIVKIIPRLANQSQVIEALYDQNIIDEIIMYLKNNEFKSIMENTALSTIYCVSILKKTSWKKKDSMIKKGLLSVISRIIRSNDVFYQINKKGIAIKACAIGILENMVKTSQIVKYLFENADIIQYISELPVIIYSNRTHYNGYIRTICHCILATNTSKILDYFHNEMLMNFLGNCMLKKKTETKTIRLISEAIAILTTYFGDDSIMIKF